MAHDEHNSGLRSGYSSALRILREVDRDIEYPKSDNDWNENYAKYNAQKDILSKVHQLIHQEMEEYTDEQF